MVDTAKLTYRDREHVGFVEGDVRDALPIADFDMYFSAGVPYSHLQQQDFLRALTAIFAATRSRPRRTAVILDVLGQYSLEWEPNWSAAEWVYDMSFFHGDTSETPGIAAPMSFYNRSSLHDLVIEASGDSDTELASIEYYDRSVMVGRHTSTSAFNPDLPRYRDLINCLYAGDTDLNLEQLEVLPLKSTDAPPEVCSFYESFSTLWNSALRDALTCEAYTGRSREQRRRLANTLCRLEHGAQRGLGSAHSLIAVAITASHD